MPDEYDGFYVFLGGYGHSMGRMRVAGDGSVLEELVEMPLVVDVAVVAVYDQELTGIVPWPGGFIVYGPVSHHGVMATMLTALDPFGDAIAHIVLEGTSVAIGSNGASTWALHDFWGGSLRLVELGCSAAP